MRSTLPLVVTFVVGIFMIGEFFIPHYGYHLVTEDILEWGLILAAGAFVLGLINMIQVNLPKIVHREKDWAYKTVMLVCLVATMVIGFAGGTDRSQPGQIYRWFFDFVLTPLNATMFALLAFYIATAAFRAFRARNLEATVLLVAACVVMLARVPIGEDLPFIGERLPQFMNWMMDVPNIAARRAIFIGAALGAVATGLRIILGLERSHLGAD